MLKPLKLFFLIVIMALLCTDPILAGQASILLVRIKGTVLVASGQNGAWEPGRLWLSLGKDTKIKTLSHSSIDLLLNKGAIVRVKGNSELVIKDMLERLERQLSQATRGMCHAGTCRDGIVIKLLKGKALFYVSPKFSNLPLLVDTPIGVAGVTGTRFAIDLTYSNRLYIAVFQGHVIVWPKNRARKAVLIGPEFFTSLKKGKIPSTPVKMSVKIRKRYEECLKLHLGLDKNHAMLETSGRYRGTFSRGYSPEVLSDFGPQRIYQPQDRENVVQTQQQRQTNSTNKSTITHHTESTNRQSVKMNKMDTSHHDIMDKHTMTDHKTMDHSGMSDHSTIHERPRMNKMDTSHHDIMDKHTMTDHKTMDHSGMSDHSTIHERPRMHETSSMSPSTGTPHGGSRMHENHMTKDSGVSYPEHGMGGRKR